MNKLENWFDSKREAGILLFRLFFSLRILYGAAGNIIDWNRMMEFSGFLQSQNFPFPTICAVVSVYAQLVCGVLIITGYKIRTASAIMAVNFLVAIIVHVKLKDSIEDMTAASSMYFGSLLLLFYGTGKYKLRIHKKVAG